MELGKLSKPLMLKDYLELEESSSVGFQCYPRRLPVTQVTTMRNLLDVELCSGPRLVRTRSKSAMERISSVIKFRFSARQEGFLSRSLSRKLKGSSFWKRRFGLNGELIKFEEETERKSFSYPSPVVSSFRSWLEVDNGEYRFGFRAGSGFVSSESPAINKMSSDDKQEQEEDQKVEERESMERSLDIEKEQLSPVSVMDFPYDEEDDDAASATTCSSPSYQFRSITNNSDRSKLQVLQKSRRNDELSNLDPVNLEDEFTASESSITCEEKLSYLLEQLGLEEIFRKVLEDFFAHGLSENTSKTKLLNTAQDWINNEGRIWELQSRRGEMEVTEMETIGKWRGFEDERTEISMDLGDLVFESLIEELVDEMRLYSDIASYITC